MKPSTPLTAAIVFAALTTVAVLFVTSAGTSVAVVLPPIGAGILGGALAYFLLEMSAWERARRASH